MNKTRKLSAQQFFDEAGQYMYEQLDEQGKVEAQELADVITQSLYDDLACRKKQVSEFVSAGGDYRKAPTMSASSTWEEVVVPTTRKECQLYGLGFGAALVFMVHNSWGLGLRELAKALDFEHNTSLNYHLQTIQHYEADANDWANKFIKQGVGSLVNYWLGSARLHQLPMNEQHPIVLQLEKVGWRGVGKAWIEELIRPDTPSFISLRFMLEQEPPKRANDFVQLTLGIFDWLLSQAAKLVEELSKPESIFRQKVERAIIDAASQEMEQIAVDLKKCSLGGCGDWIADPMGIGFDMKKALAWFILVDHKYEDAHRPLKELAGESAISYHYVREFGVMCGYLPKRGRPPKLLK